MPVHDHRTPADLLAESDQLARLLLLDVNGHAAPALLRAFPTLVEAAAQPVVGAARHGSERMAGR